VVLRRRPGLNRPSPVRSNSSRPPIGVSILQVLVRDNNVEQALRVLKKKLQREGVFREMRQHRYYEKPSERTVRERAEAVRRVRKLARKQAIREGLIVVKRQPGTNNGAAPRTPTPATKP
jgi:small subunit ribosomal protein S21